jgi:hypothetical protein
MKLSVVHRGIAYAFSVYQTYGRELSVHLVVLPPAILKRAPFGATSPEHARSLVKAYLNDQVR